MGLKRGDCSFEYKIESAIKRIDGRAGNIQVPRATYSFKMSFWIVPVSFLRGTPVLSATAKYIAYRIAAVPFMVKEVEIFDKSIPLNSSSASASVDKETPTLPTSPAVIESSGS